MIFEVPFDLIIVARTDPVIDPALFRPLLFGPLILTGTTTLAFAWSLFEGFRYPSAPGPVTLNAVSKVFALATALTLFVPQRIKPERAERSGVGVRSGPCGLPPPP